jgi:hypothetical protein
MDTRTAEFPIGFGVPARDEACEVKERMRPGRWGDEKRRPIIPCEHPRFFSRWHCNVVFQSTKAADAVLDIEQIFYGLAEKWKRETGALSVNSNRYTHPSYRALLDLGEAVIPLVLRELKQRPDWWFDALRKLTRENPASEAKSFDEAAMAWISWGRRNNLLS